jgi:competence protein ComEA
VRRRQTEPTTQDQEKRTMSKSLRNAVAFTLATLVFAPLAAAVAAPAGVVNVNTASAEQLELLPRIGPSVAGRIIEHRTANGKFASLEDLMLVRGIGERTFELLKPYLTLAGETTLAEKVRVPKAAAAEER